MKILSFASLLLAVSSSLAFAEAPKFSVVDFSQFKQGTSWSWNHFEKNTQTGEWKQRMVETYVLTKVSGKILEFEMFNSWLKLSHHKIRLDFTKCEKAAKGGPRNWALELYNRVSPTKFDLVSKDMQNLVFTEKFNCTAPKEQEVVKYLPLNWLGVETATFAPPQSKNSGDSFYFLSEPNLNGVAAQKTFDPSSEYRFEFAGRNERHP